MRSDVFFFLAIFLFIFVGWVATGGPKRPIATAGPFITPITNVGQTQYGYGSLKDGILKSSNAYYTASGSSGSGTTGNTQQDIWNTQDRLAQLQKDLRTSQLFGVPSPYKNQVSISGLNVTTTDPDQEYVTISANWSAGGSGIDITGWKLVSVATDNYGYIPTGVSLFRSGTVNQPQDIVLMPGDYATVVTGESPIGVSFKENECVGYLAQHQTFYPGLYTSCPTPQDEFDRFYTGDAKNTLFCKNYIDNLQSCAVPENIPSNIPSACISFIDTNLSYNGCVTNHIADRSFASPNWRIYLGRHVTNLHTDRPDLWDPSHDVLKLLDNQGRTVASYSY